jgi:hypothetical protein
MSRLAFAIVLPMALGWSAPMARSETLPSGTELVIRLTQAVEPRNKDQKDFSASLDLPVFAHGREILPIGSRIEGEVRGSAKEIFLSPQTLILPDGRKLDFTATVGGISDKKLKADGDEGTIQDSGTAGETVQQAGQIGVTGAEIGVMTAGTAAGAGIGAAAGVAAVLIGRKIAGMHHTMVIPAGTQLTLKLDQKLEVPDDIVAAPKTTESASDKQNGDWMDSRPILRRDASDYL